ncbi:MAG: CPBP family intramembrane glutamic endopeptidase [Vicinamibacterales bacterium]
MRTFVAQHPLLVAVAAAISVTIWRATLMLGPSQGTGPAMAIHFVVLAATPFLFLRRDGRRAIGLSWRASAVWAVVAVLSGIAAAALIGGLGVWLYAASPLNWFVTVRESMLSDERLAGLDPLPLFLALAMPAAFFSPIGEEFFFRGVLTGLFSAVAGPAASSAITAAAFGLIHAFHHGVSLGPNGPDIFPQSRAPSGLPSPRH